MVRGLPNLQLQQSDNKVACIYDARLRSDGPTCVWKVGQRDFTRGTTRSAEASGGFDNRADRAPKVEPRPSSPSRRQDRESRKHHPRCTLPPLRSSLMRAPYWMRVGSLRLRLLLRPTALYLALATCYLRIPDTYRLPPSPYHAMLTTYCPEHIIS